MARTLLPAIDSARCTGCGRCVSACRPHLLWLEPRGWVKSSVLHDPAKCTGCMACATACPFDAIAMVEGVIASNATSQCCVPPQNYSNSSTAGPIRPDILRQISRPSADAAPCPAHRFESGWTGSIMSAPYSVETAMSTSGKVTVVRDGRTYGATYTVEGDMVHVKTHTETRSVALSGRKPEDIARRELEEIVAASARH